MNVKKWLTEGEYELYESSREFINENLSSVLVEQVDVLIAAEAHIKHLESLAAERELSETRRALLEKHEWSYRSDLGITTRLSWYCRSCDRLKTHGHSPDCAITTALKGGGGE